MIANSRYTMMVDILFLRTLQADRGVQVTHVKREQNIVSHYLANFDRCVDHVDSLGPGVVLKLCKVDCL